MEQTLDTSHASPEAAAAQTSARFQWIGWSSLFFAILQSICTMFVALSGLRLLISAAAFGAALGVLKVADRIHVDTIRIPMIMFALIGAVFNLVALWQVRRLRARSASAWRQKPISRSKFASEGFQLAMSLFTLLLLAVESYYHVQHTHHL